MAYITAYFVSFIWQVLFKPPTVVLVDAEFTRAGRPLWPSLSGVGVDKENLVIGESTPAAELPLCSSLSVDMASRKVPALIAANNSSKLTLDLAGTAATSVVALHSYFEFFLLMSVYQLVLEAEEYQLV